MSFLHGRVSYERFSVPGGPSLFDESHVAILESAAIGRFQGPVPEGIDLGFVAGSHVLDLDFSVEKNIADDCLVFSFRLDTNTAPADLLRAYTHMELQILRNESPNGIVSKKDRQRAKETAKERCRDEARSGRFRKMREIPVLWDARTSDLFIGTTSVTAHDQFRPFFRTVFGISPTQVSSGTRAAEIADKMGRSRALDDLVCRSFGRPRREIDVCWVQPHAGARDFLGNEMVLWLWWLLETRSDTVRVEDGSEITAAITRSLALECPLAMTGKDTFRSEMPGRLPEAREALLTGKLPRKCGLTLVHQGEQFELGLDPETLGVSSAMLPRLDEITGSRTEARIGQVRQLSSTVDLLYAAFCQARFGKEWAEIAREIHEWIHAGDGEHGPRKDRMKVAEEPSAREGAVSEEAAEAAAPLSVPVPVGTIQEPDENEEAEGIDLPADGFVEAD